MERCPSVCLAGLAVHGTHPTTTTHQHGPLKNSVVSVSKFCPDGFSPVWHNDIIEEDRSAVSRVMQAEVKQNSCRGHVRAFHNSADGKFPAIDTVLSTPATENAAPAIDKTLEFFSVVTLALSALYLSYLLNEIFLSTGSHQRPVEQGKHGITPVMIEVNGPEVLGIHEHRAEGTPDPLPENPDIEGMHGVAPEGEDTLIHTPQLLPGDPHQVEPPVEDHGYKMINRVKQEMDDHNHKLPISSIAELSCGEDEYNLSYLFIVITLHHI